MSVEFKWFAVTVPMRKEEYFAKQITEFIEENRFQEIGPCIVPTSSFLKSEKGGIEKQVDKLRGFIFLKSRVIIDEENNLTSNEELQKLLSNFPRLRLQLEPFDDLELNKVLYKENKTNSSRKVSSGFAKGCIIKNIIKKKNDSIFEVEIKSFSRTILVELTKEELGEI